MTRTKLSKRFFGSTRGRIVTLLRGSKKTVNELAEDLGLTDNGVRAHLLSLERDGLIKQSGIQPGTRKPHFAYELTDEAEHLFPKAYDTLLTQLITALKGRLKPAVVEALLREVGRSLARAQAGDSESLNFDKRVAKAVIALEAIGGNARIEKQKAALFIRSDNCPLAAAVTAHPEVCRLAESLLSDIVGTEVRERCDRDGTPQCRFEISAK